VPGERPQVPVVSVGCALERNEGLALPVLFYGKRMIAAKSGTILNIIANYAWTGAPGIVHSASAKPAYWP
jgi:hypothetical protein